MATVGVKGLIRSIRIQQGKRATAGHHAVRV